MVNQVTVDFLGYHFLLDFYGCAERLIDDTEFLLNIGKEAAAIAKLKVIGENYHHFSPHGVTVVLMIEESHISFHSWPEHQYLAVDLFTCGSVQAAKKAVVFLQEQLPCKKMTIKEVKRGVLS